MNMLLSGKNLVLQSKSEATDYITWLELSLQDQLKPIYPLRTDNYAMLGHSKYHYICPIERA
ncbi:unnamed protein product [Commensalibacter communis]|uniref:hypothetical protein n=1 Tax=Commensalibacter communis TaxID=2972786 RepID=UPI0022FF90CA|nr:hypothetical protein [Commensalibacter communis]CAI3949171.1 unnamed protein product [Commensalibacter communis]